MGKRAGILAAISMVVLVGLTGVAGAEDLAAVAQAAISHYRAEHGLPPVTADPKLMALAAAQARAMAKADSLEHDVDRPFQARIASYDPDVACENIAGGPRDFTSALVLWEHSPGHDANLRREGVTRFGIASAPAPQSKYKVYWSLIMAGTKPHHGLRTAGGPGLLRAAPDQGPMVRTRSLRAEHAGDNSPGLLATVKGWLKPLWSGSSSAK
jgi:hypothetical protein